MQSCRGRMPADCGCVPALIIYALENHAQRYRCLHLQEQLGLYGVPGLVREFRYLSPAQAARCSLLVLHRVPLDRHVAGLIESARRARRPVLFDADDLVFDPSALGWVRSLPPGDRFEAELYRREACAHRATLDLADAALVSTDYLAQRVEALGKAAAVHRNAFSLEMLALSEVARRERRASDAQVVIGYACGTATHDADLALVRPALERILRGHPQTELWIAGPLAAGDGWGTLSERIRRLPFVPWPQLPALLARFDVSIAPLELGNPLCQAKSEIKYMEAGLVGVPTLASRTEAFATAIRSGDNGLLAAEAEDWVDLLGQLVEDATLRREMGERARADVLARYHPVVRGRELLDTLAGLSRRAGLGIPWAEGAADADAVRRAEDRAVRGGVGPRIAPERGSTLGRKALYALRHRGLRTLLLQAWVLLRRRLLRSAHAREGDAG